MRPRAVGHNPDPGLGTIFASAGRLATLSKWGTLKSGSVLNGLAEPGLGSASRMVAKEQSGQIGSLLNICLTPAIFSGFPLQRAPE